MIDKTLKKVSGQLEKMIKDEISVDRALDLLEASTSNLEEIVAINIMRESLLEIDDIDRTGNNDMPMELFQDQFESTYCNL